MYSDPAASEQNLFVMENIYKMSFENPIIVLIVLLILISLSGIFSGLTLGLMSLDEGFLNILLNCRAQIQKEVKLLLLTFEVHDRKETNFDIIDDIEEDKVIQWLNNLDNLFKRDQNEEIEDIIRKISNVKDKHNDNISHANQKKGIKHMALDKEREKELYKELRH